MHLFFFFPKLEATGVSFSVLASRQYRTVWSSIVRPNIQRRRDGRSCWQLVDQFKIWFGIQKLQSSFLSFGFRLLSIALICVVQQQSRWATRLKYRTNSNTKLVNNASCCYLLHLEKGKNRKGNWTLITRTKGRKKKGRKGGRSDFGL